MTCTTRCKCRGTHRTGKLSPVMQQASVCMGQPPSPNLRCALPTASLIGAQTCGAGSSGPSSRQAANHERRGAEARGAGCRGGQGKELTAGEHRCDRRRRRRSLAACRLITQVLAALQRPPASWGALGAGYWQSGLAACRQAARPACTPAAAHCRRAARRPAAGVPHPHLWRLRHLWRHRLRRLHGRGGQGGERRGGGGRRRRGRGVARSGLPAPSGTAPAGAWLQLHPASSFPRPCAPGHVPCYGATRWPAAVVRSQPHHPARALAWRPTLGGMGHPTAPALEAP